MSIRPHIIPKIMMLFMICFALFSYFPLEYNMRLEKKFDFGLQKLGIDWAVMNDGVMGGLSKGKGWLTKNSLVLKGEISLANNGGFSSIRSQWGKLDLSEQTKVAVRYRSYGQTIALCFERSRRWWQPYYMLDLQPTNGEWKTITLDLKKAQKYSIARPRDAYFTKDIREEILRIGFMTNDKKETEFEFEVDYLMFK